MKPLVNWARFHSAKIRLHGRSPEAVWGEFDFFREDRRCLFSYDLQSRTLTLKEDPERALPLDELGIEIKPK